MEVLKPRLKKKGKNASEEISKPVWKDYFMKQLSGSINVEKTQKEDTETQKTQKNVHKEGRGIMIMKD